MSETYYNELKAFCEEHGIKLLGDEFPVTVMVSDRRPCDIHYDGFERIRLHDISYFYNEVYESMSKVILHLGKIYEFEHQDILEDRRVAEDAARAEYNRRRSEIALQVFASYFPTSNSPDFSKDAGISFDAAEAFLKEEAKRNGDIL